MANELKALESSLPQEAGGQPMPPKSVATEADEQALAALWEKGRKAWKDVPSAADWVESLRGNQ